MKIFSLLNKSFVMAAFACLTAPGADAQVARTIDNGLSMSPGVSIVKHRKAASGPACRFVTDSPSDYGTIEVLMQEDFSKFSTGSEEAPDLDAEVILDWASGECEYPWWNVKPEYTTLPNWGGSNLFPAGGKVFMLESIFDGQGHINTPLLDFSKFDGGIAFLEFKARTTNPNLVQYLVVESAETNHMAADWRVLGGQMTPELSTQWQTYTVMFYGGGETTMFNILPQMEMWWYQDKSEEPCKVLFDDFKVYSINSFVKIPKNLRHTNYKGSEFDLTWDAMDADYYTVDIYSADIKTGERFEFKTGVRTETNSLHVTEAEAGIDYMFYVTAHKGDKKSYASLPGFVIDLVDPEFIGTPEFVKNEETGLYNYTSEWTDVPSVQVYDYALMHKRPAVQDGLFAVTDEDFTGIVGADGLTTEWTIDNPSYMCYEFLPIKPLRQAGWIGRQVLPFKDFVCLDGWHHIVGKKDVYMASPELDLSKDGGKINVSLKLFGRLGGSWVDPVTKEEYPETQTKAAVALYNYDEASGAYVQAEYVPIEDVTTAWNTFDVELTKGSARSFIVISAIEGPEHLYIDDLLITQNYKKGEYLIEPCYYEYWYEYSIIDVELPETSQGLELQEKLCAQKINPVTQQPVFSGYAYRSLDKVGDIPAGIRDAAVASSLVSYEFGMLNVSNPGGEAVAIYSADGAQVYSDASGAAQLSVRLSDGAYIVKVGSKSVKVVL